MCDVVGWLMAVDDDNNNDDRPTDDEQLTSSEEERSRMDGWKWKGWNGEGREWGDGNE